MATTKQYKHLVIAYTDITGGKTWSILEPGLRSRFPIRELIWNKYTIKQLEITFVDSADKALPNSDLIEDIHKTPLIRILTLDGDVN